METILFLAHPDLDSKPPRVAFEALHAAVRLREEFGAELHVGLIGADLEQTAGRMAGCGASSFLGAADPELGVSRYGTDLSALQAIVEKVAPTLIVAPATSRFSRVMPGLAVRAGGRIDTHITALGGTGIDGSPAPAAGADATGLTVERWYYRQRMRARLTRSARPWILLVDAGAFPEWKGDAGAVTLTEVAPWPAGTPGSDQTRTKVLGEQDGESGAQTIRPEADVLLVAGAGWAKKQADGETHLGRAEELILGFLGGAKASLGSSKSLVDQSSEGHAILSCLSHLNQVGQTGTTPRHPKGLATCCHGEEPHVVGWRFIQERRAVNLDANCGWARGKADVLYVADAFQVMEKVNEMLSR
jgi:electron transfer flavoprotein alpha subunit